MRQLWKWLVGIPGAGPAPSGSAPEQISTFERFGEILVDSARGRRILSATPWRERTVSALRDLVPGLSREDKAELIDRALLRFALWVHDLPASASHHHARPFGLLDHSIEVAHGVMEAIASRKLHVSHDPVEEERDRPSWAYAAFAAALLHDLGKVLDLEVTVSRESRWDAVQEPLAGFLARHDLDLTPEGAIHPRSGRGLRLHEWQAPFLAPLILPPRAFSRAARRLAFVWQASLGFTLGGDTPPRVPDAARQIAVLVRDEDTRSARTEGKPQATGIRPTRILRAAEPALPAPSRDPEAPIPPPALPPPLLTSLPSQDHPDPLSPTSAPTVGEYFKNAFKLAIEDKGLRVNIPGGVYVDRDFYLLAWPAAFATLTEVLRRRWAVEDESVKRIVSQARPEEVLLENVGREGLLQANPDDGSWRHEAEVVSPDGERQILLGVVLRRSVVSAGPPLFQGRIAFKARKAFSTAAEGSKSLSRTPAPASSPGAPPRKDLPRRGDPRPRPPIHPARLGSSLRRLITNGLVSRNLPSADVTITPDFTWVIYPNFFRALARDLDIEFDSGTGEEMLRDLADLGKIIPFGPGRFLGTVRTPPDALGGRPAARIETPSLFSEEDLQSLGIWPHEVIVTEGIPAPNPESGERRAGP